MPEQKLSDALKAHEQSLKSLEQELNELLQADHLQENQALRQKNEALEHQQLEARKALDELRAENQRLRGALQDQMFSERTGLVNTAQHKLDLYFKALSGQEVNRLRQQEALVRRRIDFLRDALRQRQNSQQAELLAQLEQLEAKAKQQLNQSMASYSPSASAFTPAEQAGFDALRQEPLTEEQVRQAARKNNLEAFIGQNLVNKIGVLLLVIGVFAASQYTLLRLPDLFKGLAIFLLGGLLLAGGEALSRKKTTVFSLGITAGGVAVLYIGAAVSYFTWNLFGPLVAIGVCMVITAVALLLSRRYDCQTIAAFALFGGYLPLLALRGDLPLLYGAMAYFVVLNLLALLLALRRRWLPCAFIGFGLNLMGTLCISFMALLRLTGLPFGAGQAGLLAYIFFTFLVYTAVPVLGVWRGSKRFSLAELALLGLNTVASSATLYVVFYGLGLQDLAGLLAVAFAVCYMLLAELIRRRFEGGVQASVLFYLTSYAFVALIIPFQFGRVWLSLGWLVEGLLFTLYGLYKNDKLLRRVGYAICGLCAAAFVWFDFLLGLSGWFPYRYFAITLGSLVLFAALLWAGKQAPGHRAYRFAAALNLWFYLLYACGKGVQAAHISGFSPLEADRLLQCLSIFVTVLLAYGLLHLRRLAEPLLKGLGLGLYAMGCLSVCFTNLFGSALVWGQPTTARLVTGTLLLVLVNLFALLALADLLRQLALRGTMSHQLMPVLLSAFGLLLLTQTLLAQYRLEFSSMVLSLVYMLSALAMIVAGFARRWGALRRFGLVLSMVSVAKLFLVDLFALTEGWRILSYFALGVSLIAISFVYQYFNKKLDLKSEQPQP